MVPNKTYSPILAKILHDLSQEGIVDLNPTLQRLFFGSEEGGEAAAVIFSLVQTCRGLKIDPRAYLEDVMIRLMSHPANKLKELLPDSWSKN